MIKFYCPNCKQKLGVPDEYAGRRVRCNNCGKPSIVPKLAVAASAPQSVAESKPQPIIAKAAAGSAPAPVKPAPASPKPQQAKIEVQRPSQPPPPQKPDELKLAPQENVPPRNNLEAIQRAARERFDKMPGTRPVLKSASSYRSAGARGFAKGMGKIPLSLALGIACMLGVIVLWVVLARATGFEIGYIVLGVPLAGAWGLTRLTNRRGIMLGLLAVLLGLGGILTGHLAIAKWVIVPAWEKDNDYTAAKDELQRKFSNDFAVTPSDPSQWRTIATNDKIMIHVAAWDLVDTAQMDKNTFDKIYFIEEDAEDVAEEVQAACDQAQSHLESWTDAQRIEALKKHFDTLRQNYEESILSKVQTSVKAATFAVAFLASFGLLDLLWFAVGLYGAFKLAAGIGDD